MTGGLDAFNTCLTLCLDLSGGDTSFNVPLRKSLAQTSDTLPNFLSLSSCPLQYSQDSWCEIPHRSSRSSFFVMHTGTVRPVRPLHCVPTVLIYLEVTKYIATTYSPAQTYHQQRQGTTLDH